MRNAFIEELVTAAKSNPKIILMVGDLGFGVVEVFAKQFPNQFINAGVAEQNMMGMAAGLASEGFQVFVYSIANFPTFRCAEQIRNDVDYHKLPVTIVAVGGGLAYGNLGYSHHAIQDYALMRIMPNMLIAAPGDPMEVKACLQYLVSHPQPSYLRLGKSGEPNIHKSIPDVVPGKWLSISKGNCNKTYLTTGATLELASNMLLNPKMKEVFNHHSMPLWSMKDKITQPSQIEQYSSVITVEDHLIDGGFGSWLLEATVARADLLPKIKINALDPIVCGMVGRQEVLNIKGGLTTNQL